jgi:hypothetical protein
MANISYITSENFPDFGLPLTGGTVSGDTTFLSGLTANTFSASNFTSNIFTTTLTAATIVNSFSDIIYTLFNNVVELSGTFNATLADGLADTFFMNVPTPISGTTVIGVVSVKYAPLVTCFFEKYNDDYTLQVYVDNGGSLASTYDIFFNIKYLTL